MLERKTPNGWRDVSWTQLIMLGGVLHL